MAPRRKNPLEKKTQVNVSFKQANRAFELGFSSFDEYIEYLQKQPDNLQDRIRELVEQNEKLLCERSQAELKIDPEGLRNQLRQKDERIQKLEAIVRRINSIVVKEEADWHIEALRQLAKSGLE